MSLLSSLADKAPVAMPMPLIKSLIRQFAIFFQVGLLAAFVHYSVMIGLAEVWQIDQVLAALVGYATGGIVSYVLNRRHTYRSDRPHAEATWRFILVSAVGFALTGLFMHLFVKMGGLPYIPSQVITTGIVMFWNFLANRFWTFNAP
jgi:putative flippase GtrA